MESQKNLVFMILNGKGEELVVVYIHGYSLVPVRFNTSIQSSRVFFLFIYLNLKKFCSCALVYNICIYTGGKSV